MNYTENYQLPQWEPEDRILRADFNQMCANLESALQSTAAGGQQQLTAQWEKLLDRLSPVACDLYHAIVRAGPERAFCSNWQQMRFNPFSSDLEAYDRTGLAWLEGGCLGLGSLGTWTAEQLIATSEGTGRGSIATGGTSGTTGRRTFRSPGCGTMTSLRIGVIANFGATTVTEVDLMLRLLCRRRRGDAYDLVYDSGPFRVTVSNSSTVITKNQDLAVSIPLLGGAEYQLELQWVSGSGPLMDYGVIDHSSSEFVCAVRPQTFTQGSFRETVTTPAGYQRAMALVRYNGGEVAMTLGGKAMTCKGVYTVTLEDGAACSEAEFFLSAPGDGALDAELTASCPSGTMHLHDCGFVFV